MADGRGYIIAVVTTLFAFHNIFSFGYSRVDEFTRKEYILFLVLFIHQSAVYVS
jgi:hypothetical protein